MERKNKNEKTTEKKEYIYIFLSNLSFIGEHDDERVYSWKQVR